MGRCRRGRCVAPPPAEQTATHGWLKAHHSEKSRVPQHLLPPRLMKYIMICGWNTFVSTRMAWMEATRVHGQLERGKHILIKNYDQKSFPIYTNDQLLEFRTVIKTDSGQLNTYRNSYRILVPPFQKCVKKYPKMCQNTKKCQKTIKILTKICQSSKCDKRPSNNVQTGTKNWQNTKI